ncbi:hypothetical protein DBR33_00130 [Stenotrophomonas sp. HMWF022]|nr:hypothetical protein DBR33_00130 [Stenotrophomonas sp. HMWF022]
MANELSFHSNCVWDINTLAHKALNLDIFTLERFHRTVRANVAKVHVELEVPDEKDTYPTSGYDLWQPRIQPRIGNGIAFAEFSADRAGVALDDIDLSEIQDGLKKLGRELARLPRVTSKFLVVLLERRNRKRSSRFDGAWSHTLHHTVVSEYRGGDAREEIEILEHAELVAVNGDDPAACGPTEIGVRLSIVSDELAHNFLKFVKAKSLSLRHVIGEGDLPVF